MLTAIHWFIFIAAISFINGYPSYPAILPITCDESVNAADRARILFVVSNATKAEGYSVSLYAVNDECYRCSQSFIANETTECVSLWTPHPWKLYLRLNTSGDSVAESSILFGEQGHYTVTADFDSTSATYSLSINVTADPFDSNLPFYILLVAILCFAVISFLYEPLLEWIRSQRSEERPGLNLSIALLQEKGDSQDNSQLPPGALKEEEERSFGTSFLPTTTTADRRNERGSGIPSKPGRLRSLDTFRGFSLTLMIFVNYGGGGYWYLDHAPWNGATVADFLFPWFMWIMGVSMALSFSHILRWTDTDTDDGPGPGPARGEEEVSWDIWKRVCRRSLILFLIGMFLANGYEYTTWRVPGVLQYFAVAYFVTSASVLVVFPRTKNTLRSLSTDHWEPLPTSGHYYYDSKKPESDFGVWQSFKYLAYRSRILTAYRFEWLIQLAILVLFLSVCLGVAAPGCPVGYNGPGGLSDNSAHEGCTGGIHRYLDLKTFGYLLIYHHPTCRELYECPPYDPEGLLGSLSACTLTYLGLMSGRVLLHFKLPWERLTLWAMAAFWLLLLAGILCGFSQNDGVIPVNKNLWSTSFCFLNAGAGLVGLSLCYLLVDVWKLWSGAPFLQLGMNSILIYCGHSLLGNYMPFSYMIYHYNHGSMLLCTTIGVLSWLIIALYLHHIKFFVKI